MNSYDERINGGLILYMFLIHIHEKSCAQITNFLLLINYFIKHNNINILFFASNVFFLTGRLKCSHGATYCNVLMFLPLT